jgi:hypothetical protein
MRNNLLKKFEERINLKIILLIVAFFSVVIWMLSPKNKVENAMNEINQEKEILKIEEPTIQDPKKEPKEYFIKINCTNVGDRKVKIEISTNFPNGTNLKYSVYRLYNTKGSLEDFIGEIDDKDFVVINGKYETTINVNDTDWYNKQQELIRDIPNDFPPITNISEYITVSCTYTSVKSQPETITEILGERGEFVTGEGVENWGTGTAGIQTSLSVEKEFKIPFKK